jgi:undecaprenyl diphosphate synthase
MELKLKIAVDKLPQHVAIIMDGNGRWAKKKGNQRIFGHKNAVISVRQTVEAAAELGIPYLTLYAFSTENWSRPQTEVDALMSLLISTLSGETKTLMDNNVKLYVIGDIGQLPKKLAKQLQNVISTTANNTRLTLTLALSYSGRWEIVNAFKNMAKDIAHKKIDVYKIDEQLVGNYMQTVSMPDPELLIRTSGEYRISNFLLWQIAYCELYFTDVLWPDFRKDDFYTALIDFQKRERRFGMTSEQLVK